MLASDKLVACKACGHMVSVEAKECPGCGDPEPVPISTNNNAGMGCLVIILFLGLCCYLGPGDDKTKQPHEQNTVVQPATAVGDTLIVRAEQGKNVHMATNGQTNSVLRTALGLNDKVTYIGLVANRDAWTVQNGVRVLVTEKGMLYHTVRVLDGPHEGRTGRINVDEVHR